jgi:cellulose synthase/poly-beta-1,6-N-acetylglucosamine synthase-like glycosyltransferase
MQILLWVLIFIVFYSYLGYGILLFILIKIKRLFKLKKQNRTLIELPEVTFLTAAYNEAEWITSKINNSLALDYPKDKIHFYFVTDGSTDGTPEIIKKHISTEGGIYNIELFHKPERQGKIAAVERVMPYIKSPITIFTDANTLINKEAIKNIVRHYYDPSVGAVAGEKRVKMSAEASGIGEGVYWQYESLLKKWDAELYSAVGAAGELFSIRTALYTPVEKDTLVEDFVMTLRIAQRGYRIAYEQEAYAIETHSANIKEELKRKIRISAGGLQAVWRLKSLLNPFKYGILFFQYVSHRVLRWTIAPLALPVILIFSFQLRGVHILYVCLFWSQIAFYSLALLGWFFEQFKIKARTFYIPYYFCMMNYAVYRGFLRLVKGRQSVVWEKSRRNINT